MNLKLYTIIMTQSKSPMRFLIKALLTCLPRYLKWKKITSIGRKYNVHRLIKWVWRIIWLINRKVRQADSEYLIELILRGNASLMHKHKILPKIKWERIKQTMNLKRKLK